MKKQLETITLCDKPSIVKGSWELHCGGVCISADSAEELMQKVNAKLDIPYPVEANHDGSVSVITL